MNDFAGSLPVCASTSTVIRSGEADSLYQSSESGANVQLSLILYSFAWSGKVVEDIIP